MRKFKCWRRHTVVKYVWKIWISSSSMEPLDNISFLDLQSFHKFRDWNVGAHNGAQLEAVNEFQLGTLPLKISLPLNSISLNIFRTRLFCCFYVSGASIQIFLAENWSLCISKFNLNKSTRSQFVNLHFSEDPPEVMVTSYYGLRRGSLWAWRRSVYTYRNYTF